jgi:hypothetical protein
MRTIVTLALAATIGLTSTATAASCGDEVTKLARRYDLTADLPRAERPAGAADGPATTWMVHDLDSEHPLGCISLNGR